MGLDLHDLFWRARKCIRVQLANRPGVVFPAIELSKNPMRRAWPVKLFCSRNLLKTGTRYHRPVFESAKGILVALPIMKNDDFSPSGLDTEVRSNAPGIKTVLRCLQIRQGNLLQNPRRLTRRGAMRADQNPRRFFIPERENLRPRAPVRKRIRIFDIRCMELKARTRRDRHKEQLKDLNSSR